MFRKKDLIIYLSILLLAGAVWIFHAAAHRQAGSAVQVSVDGTVTAIYPLSDSITAEINGYGNGRLTLVISDGKADVLCSSCPDLICVHHSPISHTGESIVCMPNRIVIEIIPDRQDGSPAIDAVSADYSDILQKI